MRKEFLQKPSKVKKPKQALELVVLYDTKNSSSHGKKEREDAFAKFALGFVVVTIIAGGAVAGFDALVQAAGSQIKNLQSGVSQLAPSGNQVETTNPSLFHCVSNLGKPRRMTLKQLNLQTPTLDKNKCATQIQISDAASLTPQSGVAENTITLQADFPSQPQTGGLFRDKKTGLEIFIPDDAKSQNIEALLHNKKTVRLTGLDGQLVSLYTPVGDSFQVFSVIPDEVHADIATASVGSATVSAGIATPQPGEIAFVIPGPQTSNRREKGENSQTTGLLLDKKTSSRRRFGRLAMVFQRNSPLAAKQS